MAIIINDPLPDTGLIGFEIDLQNMELIEIVPANSNINFAIENGFLITYF